MKRVLVHIGTGKTGSTSIQQTLAGASSKQQLGEIAYPVQQTLTRATSEKGLGEVAYPGSMWPSHNFLAAVYMAFEGLPRVFKSLYASEKSLTVFAQGVEAFRDGLFEAIRTHDNVILSAEYLCQFSQREVEEFNRDLTNLGVDEFCVVLYVRNPASRYLSSVQQRIKASSRFGPPTKFYYPFIEILDIWSLHFSNIVVRPFAREQLERGDVVRDFLAVASKFFGVEVGTPDLEVHSSNESISAEAMVLLQNYRECFYPDDHNVFTKDSNRLVNLLEASMRVIPQTKPQLKDEVARLVMRRHADDLELLWQRFGVDLRGEGPASEVVAEDAGALPPEGRNFELGDILDSHDKETLQRLMLRCLRKALVAADATQKGQWMGYRPVGGQEGLRPRVESSVEQSVSGRRHEALRQLLRLFPPGKCVDLGAGHGTFARQAANLGWTATAVDARTDRWPSDGRVTWVQADVREVELTDYDVVLCLGLFYHLTLEDQLDLLGRAAGRPLILDTHLDHGTHEHSLSDRFNLDGYEGRTYKEPNRTTSSWGNPESFWPTLDSFHRMLGLHGFSTVLTLEPWILGDRTFFLALPN